MVLTEDLKALGTTLIPSVRIFVDWKNAYQTISSMRIAHCCADHHIMGPTMMFHPLVNVSTSTRTNAIPFS